MKYLKRLENFNTDYTLLDAVKNGDIEAVKSALKQGANIKFSNENPIDLAYNNNHPEIAKYLIDYIIEYHPEYIKNIEKYTDDEQKTRYKQRYPYLAGSNAKELGLHGISPQW
jgi:ankyrin repeat protein